MQSSLGCPIVPLVRTVLSFLFAERADVLRMTCLPDVRQQAFQIVLAFGQTLENVAEVGPDVEVVPMSAGDHREDHGRTLAAVPASHEQPVLSSDSDSPEVAFRVVVVDRQTAVAEESLEGCPVVADVGQRRGQFALGQ